jgi:hypothetical protein
MANFRQECVHISCCCCRADPLDRLDDTVLADIEECSGEGVVGTPVDGGDDGARDQERHLIIREASPERNDAVAEMRGDGGWLGTAAGLGNCKGPSRSGQKTRMEADGRVLVWGRISPVPSVNL